MQERFIHFRRHNSANRKTQRTDAFLSGTQDARKRYSIVPVIDTKDHFMRSLGNVLQDKQQRIMRFPFHRESIQASAVRVPVMDDEVSRRQRVMDKLMTKSQSVALLVWHQARISQAVRAEFRERFRLVLQLLGTY